MKTKFIVSALIVALIAGAAVAADPVKPTVMVVNQKESGIFKIIYKGDKVAKVTMKIYNDQGSVVFNETVSGVDGFIRPVNFNGMAPGEYTIEVNSGKDKEIQKVKYTVENAVSMVHLAKIADTEKYLLAVAKSGNEEQINVKIYDGNSNIVHNETLVVKGDFGLVYNLKNVEGLPTFEVTDKTGNSKVIRY
jgi:hypothetical protein